jgi:sugar lactone lactonase YvrE
VEVLTSERAGLGESPLWHRDEQSFYWVDINADRVLRLSPDSGSAEIVFEGIKVSALAETTDGGLLFVTSRALLAWNDGKVQQVAPVSVADGTRTNDGKCDPGGRMWFGSMDLRTRDPIGSLYVFDGRTVESVEEGITLSNGLGWSADLTTMYHVDTIAANLYRYRYAQSTGTVADREVLVDFTGFEGWPDGLAVDVDGNIWVAMYDGWCVNVFDSSGVRVHVETLDVQRPTSVAFGGPDLSQLFVTTASQELGDEAMRAQPDAGMVLRLEPGTSGLPVGVFPHG